MKSSAMRALLLTLSLVGFSASSISAQSPAAAAPSAQPAPDELFLTISAVDKQLFGDIDTCDMKALAEFWSEDAEFYHDKGGLMVGRQNIVDSIKNNLCGKVKRELVPGTLEVYPINNYGAVEIGVHRFLHPWAQDHGEVGEAKFIHLWRFRDGKWQITRVISYDHGAAKP